MDAPILTLLGKTPWTYDAQPFSFANILDGEGRPVTEKQVPRQRAMAVIALANLMAAAEDQENPSAKLLLALDASEYALLVALGIYG